jgi:hypothetical protein
MGNVVKSGDSKAVDLHEDVQQLYLASLTNNDHNEQTMTIDREITEVSITSPSTSTLTFDEDF